MGELTHKATRAAFGKAIELTLKHVEKDREKGLLQLVDLTEKFMGDNFPSESYEGARNLIRDPESKWMQYVNRALDEIHPGGFAHYRQSIRVVQVLEKNGEGLNLTWEVRDGILNHRISGNPSTMEGQVVRLADKLAYIHHDMDDAQRAGIITEDDIPVTLRMLLGYTTRERLNTFVHDIIESSMEKNHIEMSSEIYEAMMDLRKIMFQNVYDHPEAKKEEKKAIKMLKKLYTYYIENPDEMSAEYRQLMKKGESKTQVVCDYLAGMTDQYSMAKFRKIYIPKAWEVY